MSNKPFRILALDGGGIRGILPATVLSAIETRTGKPICELFDIIAGTSTGGILACGLTMPDPQNPSRPKFSASELLELYTTYGKDIFQKKFASKLTAGLFRETYHHDGLVALLERYFGNAELKNTLIPILVTAYEIEHRRPFYFQTRLAKQQPDKENFLLKHVARATSAAPTYFEPTQIQNQIGEKFALVDGGVCANNPSLLAYTEATELRRSARIAEMIEKNDEEALASRGLGARASKEYNPNLAPDSVLLSIGTGTGLTPYAFEDACGWGALQWVQPIVDILMQGSSEAMHDQIQYVLPESPFGRHYYRLNTKIDTKYSDMANASDENIKGLKDIANRLVEENSHDIDELCQVLMTER